MKYNSGTKTLKLTLLRNLRVIIIYQITMEHNNAYDTITSWSRNMYIVAIVTNRDYEAVFTSHTYHNYSHFFPKCFGLFYAFGA